jgi:hypothetical protein
LKLGWRPDRLEGRITGDDQGELAPGSLILVVSASLAYYPAKDLLMQLCKFPSDGELPVAEDYFQVGQGVQQAVRRLQEDEGVREARHALQTAFAFIYLAREVT